MTMAFPSLDEMDLKILEHLANDARLSQRALARAIGMSPPAISERISRLEAAGVIKGYRAMVDWSALGHAMLVDISVLSERSADQREVAQWLLRIPEVECVDVITGPLDLRVRLRVRDPDHLRDIFFNQLLAAPGVQHTDTSIVMATVEPENFTSNILQSLLRDLGDEE